MFFTNTIPAFLATDTVIGLFALIGWIFVVAAVVWLGEKAVEKFPRQDSNASQDASP